MPGQSFFPVSSWTRTAGNFPPGTAFLCSFEGWEREAHCRLPVAEKDTAQISCLGKIFEEILLILLVRMWIVLTNSVFY